MKRILTLLCIPLLLLASCMDETTSEEYNQVQQKTVVSCVKYVQPSATGTNCTAWGSTTACGNIQDAIDAAEYEVTTGGEPYCEIWIKGGTYNVYQSSVQDHFSVEEDYIYF